MTAVTTTKYVNPLFVAFNLMNGDQKDSIDAAMEIFKGLAERNPTKYSEILAAFKENPKCDKEKAVAIISKVFPHINGLSTLWEAAKQAGFTIEEMDKSLEEIQSSFGSLWVIKTEVKDPRFQDLDKILTKLAAKDKVNLFMDNLLRDDEFEKIKASNVKETSRGSIRGLENDRTFLQFNLLLNYYTILLGSPYLLNIANLGVPIMELYKGRLFNYLLRLEKYPEFKKNLCAVLNNPLLDYLHSKISKKESLANIAAEACVKFSDPAKWLDTFEALLKVAFSDNNKATKERLQKLFEARKEYEERIKFNLCLIKADNPDEYLPALNGIADAHTELEYNPKRDAFTNAWADELVKVWSHNIKKEMSTLSPKLTVILCGDVSSRVAKLKEYLQIDEKKDKGDEKSS